MITVMKIIIAYCKAGIQESINYKIGYIVTLVGNFVYWLIVGSLWESIFYSMNTNVINGMSANQTIVYLVLSSSLYNCIGVFYTWEMGQSIKTGKIIVDIMKPMQYKWHLFLSCLGGITTALLVTFLPCLCILMVYYNSLFKIKALLILFCVSISFSIILNFEIEFLVGIICFYTESLWGINIIKEVIILFFSGAVLPLDYFGETLKNIFMFLPFQDRKSTRLNSSHIH